jgi:EpsI family protein
MFNRLALIGMGILVVQGVFMLAVSRAEFLPSPPALVDFPSAIDSWEAMGDTALDPEALAMLTPDDVLNRQYTKADRSAPLSLFIAYYKTQHKAGQAHDPKGCLPGSGWNPLISKTIDVPLADSNSTFPANYYVIAKEPEKAVVIYWYQSYNRAVAQQQILKLDRVIDTLKEHRTDMALVRVVVPVENGDLSAASDRGTHFAQSIYPLLTRQFPPKT